MPKHIGTSIGEVPTGTRKIVSVANREIGLFNIDGALYAIRNVCPHRTGPLCKGRIRPLVVSKGGTNIDHHQENEIIKCPWHQWEFDLKTGQSITDSHLRIRTYRVEKEEDNIVLYTE